MSVVRLVIGGFQTHCRFDKKLLEVAKSVGYDSDAAFSKAFKRIFGVAPREYRQNTTGASWPPMFTD